MLYINARFLTQKVSGVQRFAIEVCQEIKRQKLDVKFVCPDNVLHKDVASILDVETFGRLSGHLWEQIELPLFLLKQGSPYLLNLANTAPLLYSKNFFVLHDIAYERFPDSFSKKFRLLYRFMVPKLIKSSVNVMTVSEFSKNEISELYSVKSDSISVVHNAVSGNFKAVGSEKKQAYILAVSSLSYQKNFHSLIQAYSQLDCKDVKLYLVGAINNNFSKNNLLEDIYNNPQIAFLGRVDDEDLVKLYSGAQCFVYPSLYEGFGIPPLEAQACGCPVIVSNAASLPEVCGDSVVYCDPSDIDDIAGKIRLVLSDSALRDSLRVKGYENIKRFSWEKSARQIIKIIEENV